MKLVVNEHSVIELTEVFSPIQLITADGEKLTVMMRDSGFEVCYEGKFYELKQGKINKM